MCLVAAFAYAVSAMYLIYNDISPWKALALGANMALLSAFQALRIGRS
jgi:hypothetical protein